MFLLLSSGALFALGPGDEVVVDAKRKDINVRAATSASGELLYQVSANELGLILKGPVDRNGHRWYLIEWGDGTDVKQAGWTAMVDNWYTPTGQTLISKLALVQKLSEDFFKNRPSRLDPQKEYPDEIKKIYTKNREMGFLSLDKTNKNLSKALQAIQQNDHAKAYQEYKYAVVQLTNTKEYFSESAQIRAEIGY